MTDRLQSCKQSADGKHLWVPFIPFKEIQERAKALSDKVGGDYQFEPAVVIRIEDQQLKAQQLLECAHCHQQKFGEEVPVPEEVRQRFHETPHPTVM